MTDYIQVPVDLLSDLAESLARELDARYPPCFRSHEEQDRRYMVEMEPVFMARQIIAAAPDHIADARKMVASDVQGEPVATIHVDGSFVHVEWRIPAPSRCAMDVYTAPQPTEQPECGCCGQTVKCDDDCDAVVLRKAGQKPVPDVSALVEAAEAALEEIENIMHEAYNSAYPVCCGRPGSECCGSPAPEWEETDQRMMDRLAPHQKALREALAAHHKGGGDE